MNIEYHPCSLDALGVILASELTNNFACCTKNPQLKNPYVTCTTSTAKLCSLNSIACLLFNEDILQPRLFDFLLWESTRLRPVLFQYYKSSLAVGKPDHKTSKQVTTALATLESKYMQDHIQCQAVDVILWADLLPLFIDTSPIGLPGLDWQKKWFDKFHSQPVCGNTWLQFCGSKPCVQALATLLSNTCEVDCTGPQAAQQQRTDTSAKDEEGDPVVEVSQEEVSGAIAGFFQDPATFPVPPEWPTPRVPVPGARNLLITSALPYVNNVPHLGNLIGATLSADTYARFSRLRGYNVLYICGTDEYGTATETKAQTEKLTPREICDKYNVLHTEVYQWFDIGFDYFGRTTTDWHCKIVQDTFLRLYERNCIMTDQVEQLFCNQCSMFLADRFVEGTCPMCAYEDCRGDQCDKCGKLINAIELKQPRCKMCGATPILRTSQHLFLDLPKLQPRLEQFLSGILDHPDSLWTSNAKVIARTWLRDGLKPRCITRDLKWGIPVPLDGYREKVFYVWFDAPLGYVSITANYSPEGWRQWWHSPGGEVELVHFMAKDNVPFHSVIFPACLLAAENNFTMVRHIVSTEYMNYEDAKFSKSRNIGVFGDDAKHTGIEASIWRFYLIYMRPETQDSTFDWDDLILKNNSELLNNLGNFINRALSFLSKFFDGVMPAISPLTSEDGQFLARVNRCLATYLDQMEHCRLRDGLRTVLRITGLGNGFIQANKPWVLVKDDNTKPRAGVVTGIAVNVACLVGVLLEPFMPAVSAVIADQCQTPARTRHLPRDSSSVRILLPPGHRIGQPAPLFRKLEPGEVASLKDRFRGQRG